MITTILIILLGVAIGMIAAEHDSETLVGISVLLIVFASWLVPLSIATPVTMEKTVIVHEDTVEVMNIDYESHFFLSNGVTKIQVPADYTIIYEKGAETTFSYSTGVKKNKNAWLWTYYGSKNKKHNKTVTIDPDNIVYLE